MSFIYAEKYMGINSKRESVRILCDTKITANSYSSINFSASAYDLVLKYGIVKCNILCPELCIAYAGNNIIYASHLFNALKEKGQFEPEEVTDYALKTHRSAPSLTDIEFVIAYFSNDSIHLDCVKGGKLFRDIPFAHIGSDYAFEDFQKVRLSHTGLGQEQIKNAFCKAVEESNDDTVGGFTVEVVFDFNINSFVYCWERVFNTSKTQTVKPMENIRFYLSARDGGYSYEVMQLDIENVLFNIDQMKPSVLFSRNKRLSETDVMNPNLCGFMMPILVEINDNNEIVLFKK